MTDMRDWDSRDRHIAAEALRQAASEQRKQYAAHLIDDLTAMWLEARADELEGK